MSSTNSTVLLLTLKAQRVMFMESEERPTSTPYDLGEGHSGKSLL